MTILTFLKSTRIPFPKHMIAAFFVIVIGMSFLVSSKNQDDIETRGINANQYMLPFVLLEPIDELPLELSGTITADRDIVIASEINGLIDVLRIDEGDSVSKGSLVAIINHDQIDTQLSSAYAAYEQAIAYNKANSDEAMSSLKQSQVLLDTSVESATNALYHALEQGFDGGTTVVSNTYAALTLLSNVQKMQAGSSLYSSSLVEGYKEQAIEIIFDTEDAGSYSAPYIAQLKGGLQLYFQEHDPRTQTPHAVINNLKALQDGLEFIQKAYDEIRPAVYKYDPSGIDSFENTARAIVSDRTYVTSAIQNISDAQRTLADAKELYGTQVYTSEVSLNSVQRRGSSDVDLAAQKIKELEAIKQKAYIYAPMSGVIAERFVSSGEMVQTGSPVASLVDTSAWKIKLAVSDEYNEYIYRGAPVEVMIDGTSGVYGGVIDSIIPRVDPESRRVRFDVRLESAPASVRDGLFARVLLTVPSKDTYRIPSGFLTYGYGGPEIRIEDANTSIPVEIIRDDGSFVYVRGEELEPGIEIHR